MKTNVLKSLVEQALDDAKGREIITLDVRGISDVTDYMIIVSGTSGRHVSSMADRVAEDLRKQGQRPLGIEGQDTGDWVLLDYGDVLVHIMKPETRDFYNLEKLWGDMSVSGRVEQ